MKKYNWLSHCLYAVVLICYIAFGNNILIFLNEQRQTTYKMLPFLLGSMIIFIVLGVLLGLDKLILEMRKEGNWRLNLPKVIFLGLPSLYFSIGVFITFIPIGFIQQTIGYPIRFFLTGNFISVFQIILGYTICTSFIKIQD